MALSIIDQLQSSTRQELRHRVWIMSDLQQSDPDSARNCLTQAVDDFRSLDLDCEQIWYLGDAVEGRGLERLEDMAAMHIELLAPFEIPLKYVCGNHEFDPDLRRVKAGEALGEAPVRVRTREAFEQVPGWRTTEKLSDFYFTDSLGDYTLFFFSDHAQEHGEWISTHGKVFGNADAYPHSEDVYVALREEIERSPGPVILAGHIAFGGGLRPSALMDRMLPLPENVRVHFYGHSHIGDAAWGGPECFRKYSTVNTQKIPQFDVAALENIRGDAIRSAILEIYDDGSFGVIYREHCRQRWSDAFYIAADPASS